MCQVLQAASKSKASTTKQFSCLAQAQCILTHWLMFARMTKSILNASQTFGVKKPQRVLEGLGPIKAREGKF